MYHNQSDQVVLLYDMHEIIVAIISYLRYAS